VVAPLTRSPRVAVIGARGFVGSAVARALQARSIETVLLGRDALDLEARSWPSFEGIDCVVHAAASLAGGTAGQIDADVCSAPPLARHLAADGVGRIVYVSSGAVYGATSVPTDPTMAPDPTTPYGTIKLVTERLLASELAGALTIARLYFPYGAGQAEARLVPRLLAAVRAGSEIRCNDDGGPRVTLSHVDDVAAVLVRDHVLAEAPPAVDNVASDCVLSIAEIASALGEALGAEPVLRRDGAQPDVLSAPHEGPWRAFDAAAIVGGSRR
jgi:nucleoside-diphosphate-sugar epimerase